MGWIWHRELQDPRGIELFHEAQATIHFQALQQQHQLLQRAASGDAGDDEHNTPQPRIEI